jgi:hypothetical protein
MLISNLHKLEGSTGADFLHMFDSLLLAVSIAFKAESVLAISNDERIAHSNLLLMMVVEARLTFRRLNHSVTIDT